MDWISNIITHINHFLWGPAMLFLIGGVGLYLTFGLKFLPLRKLGYGFKQLWTGRKQQGAGDITPFNALMTSLSATIGTGNIAGVATAIALGGPGALFWMWCIALVGMATKFAEAVCAVHFRETDALGKHVGGPMYYIRKGLKPHWRWLGYAFALFGMLAGFGIGNTVQSNSVADAMHQAFGLDETLTGLILMALTAMVLLGGLQRIAKVAGKLVPFMSLLYLACGLLILILNARLLPETLSLIFSHAFTPAAATGGFAGATLLAAIRYGVARGIFSNEAGLGSAPIAHASAQTNSPVRQGTVAMLGTFIDTIVICSLTGLVILTTGAWISGENGANLSTLAFETGLPGLGHYIVGLSLSLFAFTTILGWSVYSERCTEFLFGAQSVIPFRILWVAAVPLGAFLPLNFVWLLADTLNACMAIPNLIALILLSPVVFKLTHDYFNQDLK